MVKLSAVSTSFLTQLNRRPIILMSQSVLVSASKKVWVPWQSFLRVSITLVSSLELVIFIGNVTNVQANDNIAENDFPIKTEAVFLINSEDSEVSDFSAISADNINEVSEYSFPEEDSLRYIHDSKLTADRSEHKTTIVPEFCSLESIGTEDLEDRLILDYRIENCYPVEGQYEETLADTEFRSEIDAIVAPYLGRTVSPAERKGIQDAITLQYLRHGYVTSRAETLSVEEATNTLIIPVIEGFIQDVRVSSQNSSEYLEKKPDNGEDNSEIVGLSEERTPLGRYVRTLLRGATGDVTGEEDPVRPINLSDLEDYVRRLSLDPRFEDGSVVSVLRAPVEKYGEDETNQAASILDIEVREINWDVNLEVNNESPPSLGETGIDWRTNYNLGDGSRFTVGGRYIPAGNTERSEFDSGFIDFLDELSFSLEAVYESPPIGRNLSRLTLGAFRDRNDIVRGNFESLGFRSDTERYTITYRHPLVLTAPKEFALEFGFTRAESQTFVDRTTPFPIGIGPDESGISRTSIFFFGQEYIQRGDENLFLLRSQFNLGTGLFDATRNSSSIPDGDFFSWTGQAQWLRPLSENHRLSTRAIVQLTPDSLLPVNQFVIGGGKSVRGYRQNFRAGDNGLVFSVEDKIKVFINGEQDWLDLQVIPFFDAGWVWNNGNNPNQLPDPNFIASLGVGIQADLFKKKNLRVRVDYGIPLVSGSEVDSDFREQRWHFSLGYTHIIN